MRVRPELRVFFSGWQLGFHTPERLSESESESDAFLSYLARCVA